MSKVGCSHVFFQSEYHTQICAGCGVEFSNFGESNNFKNSSYEQRNMPFCMAYSRRKRFTSMLESLLFGTLTHLDNHVVEMIANDKIRFKTTPDMFEYLKKKKCSDKRYSSAHGFARLFVQNYIPPQQPHPIHCVINKIAMSFEHIEVVFLRLFYGKPFFNYGWLLQCLLKQFNLSEYIVYVKKLKCKRRVLAYEKMLNAVTHDFSYRGSTIQDDPSKIPQPPLPRVDDHDESLSH